MIGGMSVREKNIEEYLRDQVRISGGWAPKWESPGNNGVPDRIVFLPGGRVVFVELKAPGKKPTPLQMSQHRRLQALGQNVKVIDSKQAVNDLLAAHREGRL